MMIYFDNAATSFPKPPAVTDAVVRAAAGFGNPSRGSHPFAMAALRSIEEARERAAALFGCPSPGRTAFTKNATEALNIAVNSISGHIVTTEAEHNSLLRPLYRRRNFSIVSVDSCGRYTAEDVLRLCRPETAAVAVSHASNVTGNTVPLADLGRLCRERDLLLIADAAQTAGLLDIDMERMDIDALCFSGHKSLYGLQGTGGICLSERFTPRPLAVGGSGSRTFGREQPRQMPDLLEAGTPNAHGLAALAAGMAYVMEQTPARLLARAGALARRFAAGAAALPGAVLYGEYNVSERVPIVTLNIGTADSAEIAAVLADRYGMAVRGGAHCAPLLHERFGTRQQGAVRFSFSHWNTEAEIDAALAALAEISEARQAASGG